MSARRPVPVALFLTAALLAAVLAAGAASAPADETCSEPAAPGTPTGVTAGPGNGAASISWVAGIGCDATSFTVTATPRGGGSIVTAPASGTSLELSGLDPAKTYDVSVVATNDQGSSAASDPVAVDPFGPPTADFTISPSPPNENQLLTFTSTSSDPDGDIVSTTWTFDGEPAVTGTPAYHEFKTPGLHTVSVTVVDAEGLADTETRSVSINEVPSGTISGPTSARVNRPVTFVLASHHDDGSIVHWAWDLDNDGVYDHVDEPSVITTFTSPGPKQPVRVRLTDVLGAAKVVEVTIDIIENRPPYVTGLTVSTPTPLVGEPVALRATAFDPDGDAIVAYRWDVNGDGRFEASEPHGATATYAFPRVGGVPVSVQVEDADGAVNVLPASLFINVRGTSPTTTTPTTQSPATTQVVTPPQQTTPIITRETNVSEPDDVGTPLETVRESLETFADDLGFDGIRTLLANPLTSFVAPGPGIATHTVEATLADLKKAKAAARRKPVVLASGRRSFSKAGVANIRVKVTRRGRAALKKAKKRLRVTVRTSFTPKGGKRITRTRRVTLVLAKSVRR